MTNPNNRLRLISGDHPASGSGPHYPPVDDDLKYFQTLAEQDQAQIDAGMAAGLRAVDSNPGPEATSITPKHEHLGGVVIKNSHIASPPTA